MFGANNNCSVNRTVSKRGCFNSIRLFLALKVLYGHATIHLKIELPEWIDLFFNYAATPLFFMMSGFLIWGSTGKTKDFKEHCIKRFLRIYPELWMAVLIELLLILFMYHEPIDWGLLGVFAVTQSTIFQFWTPDFLRGYGCGTPNGSLWTICVLIQFYFLVYYIYKLLHGRKDYIWFLTILFSIIISYLTPTIREFLPNVIGKLIGQTLIPYLWIFLVASYVSENKDYYLPILRKYILLIFFFIILIKFTGVDFKATYFVLFTVCMFLFLVGVAYLCPKLDVNTDISYGVYLYHMTVINVFISLAYMNSPWLLLFVILITCFLAWISSVTIGNWSKKIRERMLK